MGEQLWNGVVALVRRPFRRQPAQIGPAVLFDGTRELAALESAPGDESAGVALAQAIVARASGDAEFSDALRAWWAQASETQVVGGDVTNTISGGTFSGPVFQGRDFTGLTFTNPPQPPAPDG